MFIFFIAATWEVTTIVELLFIMGVDLQRLI